MACTRELPFGDPLTREMRQVLDQLGILEQDQSTTTGDASHLDAGVVARVWATWMYNVSYTHFCAGSQLLTLCERVGRHGYRIISCCVIGCRYISAAVPEVHTAGLYLRQNAPPLSWIMIQSPILRTNDISRITEVWHSKHLDQLGPVQTTGLRGQVAV